MTVLSETTYIIGTYICTYIVGMRDVLPTLYALLGTIVSRGITITPKSIRGNRYVCFNTILPAI